MVLVFHLNPPRHVTHSIRFLTLLRKVVHCLIRFPLPKLVLTDSSNHILIKENNKKGGKIS
ncbi:UNVERIFIED_CONTAM: CRISPR-associated DxTHG motif protein [Bacillus sp. ATCC 13368]